jgi:hypothetical protein
MRLSFVIATGCPDGIGVDGCVLIARMVPSIGAIDWCHRLVPSIGAGRRCKFARPRGLVCSLRMPSLIGKQSEDKINSP